MKLILAGSTGFIGAEVLRQCLTNPSITSLVALSRRELPSTFTDPDQKLKTMLVKDFEEYGATVIKECEGAAGCIWYVHTTCSLPTFEANSETTFLHQDLQSKHRALGTASLDIEIQKKVTLDYTVAAAEAFLPLTSISKDSEERESTPFRFIFTSGFISARDQSKPLWFMAGPRRINGEAENKLLDFTAEHKGAFDAFIIRPAVVIASDGGVAWVAECLRAPVVSVQRLAAVMIELALNGGQEKIWENRELVSRGRELLKGQVKKRGG